jgi:hypothetical protein
MIAANDDRNISFVPSRYLGRLFDREPTHGDEPSNWGGGIHEMGSSSGQIDRIFQSERTSAPIGR